jgi:formate-dependent nitrite reductase membrane component NrfD
MWSTMLKPRQEHRALVDAVSSSHAPKTLNALKAYEPLSTEYAAHVDPHIVYDTQKNRQPWGWMVSAYLGTKALGAGAMIVAAFALALYGFSGGLSTPLNALIGIGASVIGGFFIALTLVLLVADLKRPERFLYLMTKANPTSWLVWGGVILVIFGLIEGIWFVASLFSFVLILRVLLIPTLIFGFASAGYTAFLFGQAEGRDFWQSPLLFPMLLVQAALAGAAGLGILAWILDTGNPMTGLLSVILLTAVVVHLLLMLFEVFGAHGNSHIAAAAHFISHGRLRGIFWGVVVIVGSCIPVVLLAIALSIAAAAPILLGIGGILALIGLFAYEHCFVTAGQIVPLS